MKYVKALQYGFLLLAANVLVAETVTAQVPVVDLNQNQGAEDSYSASAPPRNIYNNDASLPLEQQIRILQQQVDNLTQVDWLGKIDNLQQQIQALNGKIEEQAHSIQTLTDQQKSFYQDLNQRILEVQTIKSTTGDAGSLAISSGIAKAQNSVAQNVPPSSDESSSNALPEPASVKPMGAGIGPDQEEKAYQTAFNMVIKKQNTEAISAFQSFLKTYPTSKRAPNVHYWLAELYSKTGKNDLAQEQLNLLITQYPTDSKVPDAMLKLAIMDDENGLHEKAQKTLREIIQKYPDSNAARLAKVRLQQMMTSA